MWWISMTHGALDYYCWSTLPHYTFSYIYSLTFYTLGSMSHFLSSMWFCERKKWLMWVYLCVIVKISITLSKYGNKQHVFAKSLNGQLIIQITPFLVLGLVCISDEGWVERTGELLLSAKCHDKLISSLKSQTMYKTAGSLFLSLNGPFSLSFTDQRHQVIKNYKVDPSAKTRGATASTLCLSLHLSPRYPTHVNLSSFLLMALENKSVYSITGSVTHWKDSEVRLSLDC